MGEMGFFLRFEEGHHGAFEGLRATGGFGFRCQEHPRGEGFRRLTQNRPVGDQQSPAGEPGAAGQIIQLIGLGQRLEPSCCAVDHHLGTILARGNPNDKLI